MPIKQSAKKALRQSNKKRLRNRVWRARIARDIKNARKNSEIEDPKEKNTLLSNAYKTADKAAKKGIINNRKAARIKSRLSKHLHANSK
jgi:small subunit ribosomal protein S20